MVYYLHTDYLGSTSVLSEGAGGEVPGSRVRYYPYGQTRVGNPASLPTDYTFTGQRWEQSLGLYDYRARYYDPALGRFISADTIVPNPANPQDLNRYSYVRNNPLRYTDPTGHYILLEEDFGVRITGEGVIQIVEGGRYFVNPVEVALANAILSGDPRHLEAIPSDMPPWAIERSLANVLVELGYREGGPGATDVLLDPALAFGLAFGMVKVIEGGDAFPAVERPPAGERLEYTETIWDAARRGPNAIGRWGEQQVGRHLSVEVGRFRVLGGRRIYDGYIPAADQYVEVKTTTHGRVCLSSHIRRQIAFDAAQEIKPLWIFVNGSPSRGLQVALGEAGIPWQVLDVP